MFPKKNCMILMSLYSSDDHGCQPLSLNLGLTLESSIVLYIGN